MEGYRKILITREPLGRFSNFKKVNELKFNALLIETICIFIKAPSGAGGLSLKSGIIKKLFPEIYGSGSHFSIKYILTFEPLGRFSKLKKVNDLKFNAQIIKHLFKSV